MKTIIRRMYVLIYSHVTGNIKEEKISSINQLLTLYVVLSPITIILAFLLMKIGIAVEVNNKIVVALLVLIYVFGLNYIINKFITTKFIEYYIGLPKELKKKK